MQRGLFLAFCLAMVVIPRSGSTATYYVATNSASDGPGTSWATAFRTIQRAIDVTVSNDIVLVTNGVYASGGAVMPGDTLTNRACLTNAITLRSVNGPDYTFITGNSSLGNPSAVRGVYMTNLATIVGFTIQNGSTLIGQRYNACGGGILGSGTDSVVSNCVVRSNTAAYGGGIYSAKLYNSIICDNQAYSYGGLCSVQAYNSAIYGNIARSYAGGMFGSYFNCTITGNRAASTCGGLGSASARNCIIYYNTAADVDNADSSCTLDNCNTPVIPPYGSGSFTNEPLLVSATHIATNSPCVGAGIDPTEGVDFDSEIWRPATPSVGCDQVNTGSVTGVMTPIIAVQATNIAVNTAISLSSRTAGRVAKTVWNFGDNAAATNIAYATHSWSTGGTYAVILRSYNETTPAGVAATVNVRVVAQPVHYVAVGGASVSPFTSSWANAATNIQDAVNAVSVFGAKVLVSNGVYSSGATPSPWYGVGVSNRVALTNGIVLESVNGAAATVITGLGPMGSNATRCIYVDYRSSVKGFTFSNGFTAMDSPVDTYHSGAGIYSAGGVVSNCVIKNNSAGLGGGSSGGTVCNSLYENNRATFGGGAASGGNLSGCVIRLNSADTGGGVNWGSCNACTLYGNTAREGGATYGGTMRNCNVIGNKALTAGGIIYTLAINSIIYDNQAQTDPNYTYSDYYAMSNSCSSPLSPGIGNISAEPKLSSVSHLATGSPCIGTGSATGVSGVDIDGETWLGSPGIGCDEYVSGALTGTMAVSVLSQTTNIAPGISGQLFADIAGKTVSNVWNFGDGVQATNKGVASHAWSGAGNYPVVVTAFNNTYPSGISGTTFVQVVNAIHYVKPVNAGAAAPFTSWATAATNIQDAVNACATYGGTVLVTNGTFSTGGVVGPAGQQTNRVVLTNGISLRSVNGRDYTTIVGTQSGSITGPGSVRCVFLEQDTSVAGFSLINAACDYVSDASDQDNYGGAVYTVGGVVSNCMIGNSRARYGGGVSGGTIRSCVFSNNSAMIGGGAYNSAVSDSLFNLNACNWYGAGMAQGVANNCVFSNGSAGIRAGGAYYSAVTNSLFIGNNANNAGATYAGSAYACIYSNNWAESTAGAAGAGFLINCYFVANTGYNGGAFSDSSVSNCIARLNVATNGGACYNSLVYNSLFVENTAFSCGGGSYGGGQGTLYNTTICSNRALFSSGGAFGERFFNCIVYYNTVAGGYENDYCYAQFTCISTNGGPGNTTNAPQFVNIAAGDYRLAAGSPCINTASNEAWTAGAVDLLGRPRVMAGLCDMGAYEYISEVQDTDSDGIPDYYEWDYSGGMTGIVSWMDNDHDGVTNAAEFIAGTDPNSASSLLEFTSLNQATGGTVGAVITWQSVAGRLYAIDRATNLIGGSAFNNLVPSLTGNAGTMCYTDTTATATCPYFYKIKARLP